jgi:addiction module HigA family antidote
LNLEDHHLKKKTMPMLNPPHPGEFIRSEVIEPLGLSVTDAAEALGVSRPTLSTLLNGKSDLSGDMALRIEKAFGPKMETLMRMQSSYDIARAQARKQNPRPPSRRRGDCLKRTKSPDQPHPGAGPGTVFLSCDYCDNSRRIFRA